jgi:hypothetical protein
MQLLQCIPIKWLYVHTTEYYLATKNLTTDTHTMDKYYRQSKLK